MKGKENGVTPPELTEAEVLQQQLDARALFFQHMRRVKEADDEVEDAKTRRKEVRAQIREEGGKLKMIDRAIIADSDEGAKDLRTELEDMLRLMRWLGIDVGTEQAEMFPAGEMTSDQRVADDGLRAGLSGKTCDCPYPPGSPHYNLWLGKWQEGQAALIRSKMRPLAPTPIEEAIADTPEQHADEPPAPPPEDAASLSGAEWKDDLHRTIEQGDAMIKAGQVGTKPSTFRVVS